MTLNVDTPGLAPRLARLAPYARHLVQRSGALALRLNADEVGPEHLLITLMEDEDCAAHHTVLHAFADPESLAQEALATANGILVVGSRCSLPFSTLGVRALVDARARASERGAPGTQPLDLVHGSFGQLPAGVRAAFREAGWQADAPERESGSWPESDGALFHDFSDDAKRSLSNAARLAQTAGEASISPAQMLLAVLQEHAQVADAVGLSWAQARNRCRGATHDETPPPPRSLPPEDALLGALDGAPEGATSGTLLGIFLGARTPELAQLLTRNKVTRELVERAGQRFEDPDPPPEGEVARLG